MAMIICPECGREISDKAVSCPGCGCPASDFSHYEEKNDLDVDSILETEAPEKFLSDEISRDSGRIIPDYPYTICSKCEAYNRTGVFVCVKCGHRYSADEYKVISPWKEEKDSILHSSKANKSQSKVEFNGIYRYTNFGKKEVYCPRCGSEDCSYYQEQKIIPGKTKTRYTANLNPLHPFTLVNKKEKVIKKDKVITENKIICNKCGKIFY